MLNLGMNRASGCGRWPVAMVVPAVLFLVACPRHTGGDVGLDAEVVDAAPVFTAHVVLLHTADTIGYVEPCG